MKQIIPLFLLLALLLAGCQSAPAEPPESGNSVPPPPGSSGPSEPLQFAEEETAFPIPAGESFFLTYWDGNTLLEQFCHGEADLNALSRALPEIRGIAAENWTVPESPWPIYGLETSGTEEDFKAAYCGGVWLDSFGHVLQADLDFPALWEQFAQDPTPRTAPQPAIRELALRSGAWDSRALRQAEKEAPSSLVPMDLTISGSGVGWTITNQTGQAITTGNGSTAVPQVLLDSVWYNVPALSGGHYAWTMEAYSTAPGETFSGTLWQAPYGPLPDGDYRLVLHWSTEAGLPGLSAAPFHVQDGVFSPSEARTRIPNR